MLRFAPFSRLSRCGQHLRAAKATCSSRAAMQTPTSRRIAPIVALAAANALPRRCFAKVSKDYWTCSYCSVEIADLGQLVTLACKHAVHASCADQAMACQRCSEQVQLVAQQFEESVRLEAEPSRSSADVTASQLECDAAPLPQWDDVPWYAECPKPLPGYDPMVTRKVTIPVYKQPHLDRFHNVVGGGVEGFTMADYPPRPQTTDETRPDARRSRSGRAPARMHQVHSQPATAQTQNAVKSEPGPSSHSASTLGTRQMAEQQANAHAHFGPVTVAFPNYALPPVRMTTLPVQPLTPAFYPTNFQYFTVPPPVMSSFTPTQWPLHNLPPLTNTLVSNANSTASQPQTFFVVPPVASCQPYQQAVSVNVQPMQHYAQSNLTNFATAMPNPYVDASISQPFATNAVHNAPTAADTSAATAATAATAPLDASTAQAYAYHAPAAPTQEQYQYQYQYQYYQQPNQVYEDAPNPDAAVYAEEAQQPADYSGNDTQNWSAQQ